jgi:opine dehydrogenase
VKVAVLGGGHGCYAAAADLTEQGHEVRLWRRDAAALAPVLERNEIVVADEHGRRPVRIALATADIGAAVRGAALVLIPSPAIAQQDIARAVAPHLSDGQVVFLPPGTFGSVVMSRIVRERGNRAEVAWAETGTLPYLARKHGPAEVAITIRATRLPTGVHPAKHSPYAYEVIRAAYRSLEACEDALSAALLNAGPIIHPPLVVMNAAPLQHFERWDIHHEGTQPAVRAVTDRLDHERIALREALGYASEHFPLADHYNSDRWMYGDAHKKLVKSGDWREHIDLATHRYVTEDVEMGLAFLASVARWAGVDAPIVHGLLAVVGGFLGRDLRRGARTFEALGLDKMSRAEIKERLREGTL